MNPLVVSIGTTHPRNVAGLGRDARVAADYGLAHAMAVAAVSAQDEGGVHDLFVLAPAVLRAQLGTIDFANASAVRVGALGSVHNAQAAADMLQHSTAPIVFDPVMGASAGGALYDGDALQAVRAFLSPTRAIVTPNLDEARQLTGCAVDDVDAMIAAGKRLIERGARAALIKGGHLAGDPVDVLVSENGVERFGDARLPQKMRGTGCTLAMALACELALGRDLVTSVKGARAYVRANIARS
jgi:hydroxymethylpyrimidine kinase/phosphomethylpyrimidine kinase